MKAYISALAAVLAILVTFRAESQPVRDMPGVSCEGAFTKDANHQKFVEAFGSQNVSFVTVSAPNAPTPQGRTIIYPNDAMRRLEVYWRDQATRTQPSSFAIVGISELRGPNGVHIGMTLEELEAANGEPFALSGYNGIDRMTFFKSGALANLPGCVVHAILRPTIQLPDDQIQKIPDHQTILSSDPTLRMSKPRVVVLVVAIQP